MKSREEFLQTIADYNPKYDLELIGRAYDKAKEMHEGQLRKSGEPYLIHPLAVAEILADLGMDEDLSLIHIFCRLPFAEAVVETGVRGG